MATENWQSNNPKVAGYLSKELYNQLEVWMKDKGIRSVSQAVSYIFQHYLTGKEPIEFTSEELKEKVRVLEDDALGAKERLTVVESKLDSLAHALVEAGAKNLAYMISKQKAGAPTERQQVEYADVEAKFGLTKTQLCQKLGITVDQANRKAEEMRLEPEEYLFKVTGWKASGEGRPKYYPMDS